MMVLIGGLNLAVLTQGFVGFEYSPVLSFDLLGEFLELPDFEFLSPCLELLQLLEALLLCRIVHSYKILNEAFDVLSLSISISDFNVAEINGFDE